MLNPDCSRDVSIKVPKSLFFFLTDISQNMRETTVFSLMLLSDLLCEHMRSCQLQHTEWSINLQHEAEKCGWQCFGRNSCGRAGQCVAACVDLSVFLQSYPSTEGLQRSQWVGVKSKEVRKTTTGSASAQGLSTATASCICLTFPKQNTEPPNSSFHFPPADSHIYFPYSKTKWLHRFGALTSTFCCSPHDTLFVLLTKVTLGISLVSQPSRNVPLTPPHTHTHTLFLCASGFSKASTSSHFLACSYSHHCAPW